MDVIAFARGVPAPEMLLVDELRTASRRAFDADPVALLSYGTGAGWPPLRDWLAERQGVEPDRVVVTTGSLQGFALLAEVLAERASRAGRRARVLVEQPTYDRPLLLLERLGIEVVPVPVDADGVEPDAFEAAVAGGVDLAYLIPTYQNPSGATLALERRSAILAAAERHRTLVLEDDPYGSLHFDEPAPTSLFELATAADRSAQVAYSGSFSKTVAPGLRVGWMVLPRELAADVARRANDTYISASFIGQATVHAFVEAGDLQRSVDQARATLATRCTRMCAALDEHLPGATYTAPSGGYFAWVRLPGDLDAVEVARVAPEHGVSFVPGSSFGLDCEPYVRLAFSSPPVESIEQGVRRLAAACTAAMSIA